MRPLALLFLICTACAPTDSLLDAGVAPKSLCNVFCASNAFCASDFGTCKFCNHGVCGPLAFDPSPPPPDDQVSPPEFRLR